MEEENNIKKDLAQLAGLAVMEKSDDVRLFVARLVRKYRSIDPELAEKFDNSLRSKPSRSNGYLRKGEVASTSSVNQTMPVDEESRLFLLKNHENAFCDQPLLSCKVKVELEQLIIERRFADKLELVGLPPSRSAIFVGKPGVGKTLSTKWLADQLGLPLYVLDLTAVMSSFLGKTGSNLRAAIDFAKQKPCILLLDEIDAIAKRRNDDADIGELKRLVTVMLQEVDSWPATSLLLAATNHPELIDPALWRRFDLIINFDMPDKAAIKMSIERFLKTDYSRFEQWSDVLSLVFKGDSFSEIERTINRFRRSLALGLSTESKLVEGFVSSRASVLEHQERIELAALLAKETKLSQHRISDITGVSRDTIRKRSATK